MIRQSFDLEILKARRSLGASQCQFWPRIVEHEHLRLPCRMFMLGFYLLIVSFRGQNCLFKIILNIDFYYFSLHFRWLWWSDPIPPILPFLGKQLTGNAP